MDKRHKLEQIKWRARRSQLELDLLLNKHINTLDVNIITDNELTRYADILTYDDDYLLLLLQGKITDTDPHTQEIINKIKVHFLRS